MVQPCRKKSFSKLKLVDHLGHLLRSLVRIKTFRSLQSNQSAPFLSYIVRGSPIHRIKYHSSIPTWQSLHDQKHNCVRPLIYSIRPNGRARCLSCPFAEIRCKTNFNRSKYDTSGAYNTFIDGPFQILRSTSLNLSGTRQYLSWIRHTKCLGKLQLNHILRRPE